MKKRAAGTAGKRKCGVAASAAGNLAPTAEGKVCFSDTHFKFATLVRSFLTPESSDDANEIAKAAIRAWNTLRLATGVWRGLTEHGLIPLVSRSEDPKDTAEQDTPVTVKELARLLGIQRTTLDGYITVLEGASDPGVKGRLALARIPSDKKGAFLYRIQDIAVLLLDHPATRSRIAKLPKLSGILSLLMNSKVAGFPRSPCKVS